MNLNLNKNKIRPEIISNVVSFDAIKLLRSLEMMLQIHDSAFCYIVDAPVENAIRLLIQSGRNSETDEAIMAEICVPLRRIQSQSVNSCWKIDLRTWIKCIEKAKTVKIAVPPLVLFIDTDWGEIVVSNPQFDLINVQSVLITPFSTEFAEMESKSWSDLIEFCSYFSNEVYLIHDSNLLIAKPYPRDTLNDDKNAIEIKIPLSCSKKQSNEIVFSSRLLKKTTDGPSNDLKIQLSHDAPLLVEYELKFGAKFRFFLAPLE